MKIACLGWGSLIWRPEILKIQRQWFSDGPFLPVEFVRQSKDGRLTLAINANSKPTRVLWALMDTVNLEESKTSLQEREGIKKENIQEHIGIVKATDEPTDKLLIEIREWVKTLKLDAAIWTALKPKFNKEDRAPTVEESIAYLRALEIKRRNHAEEYIRRAPRQIDTQYRQAFEKEFNWTPIE